jgi:hypothetical protein
MSIKTVIRDGLAVQKFKDSKIQGRAAEMPRMSMNLFFPCAV